MRTIVHFVVLVLALCCTLTCAIYVDAPEEITLLPRDSDLVYFALYNFDVLKDETIVFDPDNSCLDDLSHEFQKTLNQSGVVFRKCYELKDEHIVQFLSIANVTEHMARFQKDNVACLKRVNQYYEFNCYVDVIQTYLQKVYSYIHRPQNSFEWNMQYTVAQIKFKKLTLCTGAELKLLMENVKSIQDAAVQCS